MSRIGILGGTFDPIHNGHLHIAQQVREKLSLDKVILIPAGVPPHKRAQMLADGRHRYAMAIIACHNLRDLEVSDIEVRKRGISYTVDTVRLMKAKMPDSEFYLILGSDAASEFHTWYKAEELVREVVPVVVFRPGHPVDAVITGLEGRMSADAIERLLEIRVDIEPVPISSTEIRRRLASGGQIRGFVRYEVEEYIRAHGLYGTRPEQR
jgi:nicotinate-nucleotide adenylyltransferase